jgi:Ca-activated chloride channel family protein
LFRFCSALAALGLHLSASAVTCQVLPEREVLPANEKSTTVIKVTLDAPAPPAARARSPVNLCIVLDRSGSMSGKKLEKAKQAAVEAVQRLSRDDVFSLVTYSDRIETLLPAAPARDGEALARAIGRIGADGNTALFGGVSQGASEIRKHLTEQYVHRILLLSDGLANVGPATPEELGRLGASLRKESISVTTIGVGDDYNEDLMNTLAGKSDGNTYFVAEAGDLPRIFQAELGDVLNTVASDVIIEIRFADGVRPRRLVGREGQVEDGRVEVQMNQLYGGQQKYVLVEVEVDGRPAGDAPQPLAEARVRYRDRVRDADANTQAQAQVRFSTDAEAVKASGNKAVGRELVLIQAAERREQAVQAWEAGRKEEAKGLLQYNGRALREASAAYEAPGLAVAASQDELHLEKLDKDGLDKRARKSLLTTSAQDKAQQKSR